MQQITHQITISTNGQNLYDFTNDVKNLVINKHLLKGIINISILHTSASLLIQENADPDVLKDLKSFFNNLVPIQSNYLHNSEGLDDMPAHIKSALTNTNISISVNNNKLVLGKWQGLYLFEHREGSRKRNLFLHFLGI